MRKLTIIIPVYRGLQETKECILSVVDNLPCWAELLVINDCSPEPDLTNWLRSNSKEKNYELYENDDNLGFVSTVNRGMKLAVDNDVLLLNSDVESPNSDWLERMRCAAYQNDKTASLTPFSNNATICSFPNFCEDNDLFKGLSVTELDSIFKRMPMDTKLVKIPTGIGFCMYIRRDCLDDIGYFDVETFGKGYGEENDWCQRAEKSGWNNYHQLNVFSYHKGGVSFAEEGDPRKEQALKLLQIKHPGYNLGVQRFISNDPVKDVRLRAILGYLKNSQKYKILLITHALGGGVTQHLDELELMYGEEIDYIRLAPFKNGASIALSLGRELKNKYTFDLPADYQELCNLLKLISVDHVHIHHTLGLPESVFGLWRDLNLKYDVTIHDYYLFGGNPTLTNKNGKFVGDDSLVRNECCSSEYELHVPISEWKASSEKLLINAQRIIFPSKDTYSRFVSEFPFIENKSIVAYHPDIEHNNIDNYCVDNVNNVKKVLVLGAISREKGADKLEMSAINSPEIEFHLLGYAYRNLERVITHGAYDVKNVEEIIKEINPDVIWFPAQWPETYSYTLSTSIVLKYPIVYPNIGAFPERLMNRKYSICLPWNINDGELVRFWKNIDIERDSLKCGYIHHDIDVCDDFYHRRYLEVIERNKVDISRINEDLLIERLLYSKLDLSLSKKENVLLYLWRVQNSRVLSKLVKRIPLRWQRYVKKKFSQRPLHELLKKK